MPLHAAVTGSGPTLVILHGLFGSGDNWRTLSRQFGERYTVHAVDLPGHGASPHLRPLTYAAMADALERYLDEAGIESAFLLGHSMGGKVAMEFALLHPERVDRLIVADIAPRRYPPGHAGILAALSGLDLDAVTSRNEAGRALAGAIPDVGVRRFLLKNLVRKADGRYRWQLDLDGIRADYEAISDGLHAAGLYDGPTLFIRGGASGYVRDADLETIRAYFPQADIETIPGAGHWVHAEAPEAFAEAVFAFLPADA